MSLLPCMLCQQPATWHYAKLTSHRQGKPHFIFAVCNCHPWEGVPSGFIVPQADKPATEQKWNDAAAALFAERTAKWSAVERERFRVKLGMPAPAVKEGK